MGEVYEALQVALDRRIALKLLSGELADDTSSRVRFRREALAQAGVDHPNIVGIYDAGQAGDRLFIAMQLIRGPTLKEMLRIGALDPERAVRVLAPVASALDTAHRTGLIHRDVKPQNVLVGAGEHPYLADFGLTKALGDNALTSLTASGHFVGTLSYIAPEQLTGEEPTARSDIYSFAAMMFECLAGRLPFPHTLPAALVNAHMNEPVPAIAELAPTLPGALDGVMFFGLAKDPSARPRSAGELVDAAAAALRGEGRTESITVPLRQPDASLPTEPVSVPPGSPPSQQKRPSIGRRTTVAVAGLGVATALAVAALIFGGDDVETDPPVGKALLGSTLTSSGAPVNCSGGEPQACTIVQRRLPGAEVVAPFDGVVTSWRMRGAKGRFRLVVLSDNTLTGMSSFMRARETHERFGTQVPIRAGDLVGLETKQNSVISTVSGIPGAEVDRWLPPLSSPGVDEPPDKVADPPDTEILIRALIEPDADSDEFGDLSQDRCPGESGTRDGCP